MLAFVSLVLVGCSSSGSDEASTSTGEITSGDAGTDAASSTCLPCAERFAAGKTKYDAARRSCYCPEEVCRDACGSSLCLHQPIAPTATCNECIATNSKCVLDVTSACEADAECKKYVLCKVDDPCAK